MQEALGLIQKSVNFSSITIAAPQGEAARDAVAFHGRCHVETLRGFLGLLCVH